jgi:hypothetical protein
VKKVCELSPEGTSSRRIGQRLRSSVGKGGREGGRRDFEKGCGGSGKRRIGLSEGVTLAGPDREK